MKDLIGKQLDIFIVVIDESEVYKVFGDVKLAELCRDVFNDVNAKSEHRQASIATRCITL